jgi:hypothetical protein
MKLAYLILVHNQPQQLKRMIERLSTDDTDFYVHVDKKVSINEFRSIINFPNVFFVQKRKKVYWGAYSIVQATVNGFEAIIQSKKEYDFISLLSGQDYPLKTNDVIFNFFQQNKGKAFMEFYSVEDVWKEAIPRLKKYFLTNYPFRGSERVELLINKLLPARKTPEKIEFVGRSQWFSISLNHVKYIVDFLQNNKRLVRFFRLTWGSDEFVFQTVLYNSPFKKDMVNDNLRYIDWSAGQPSPKTFTIIDLPQLLTSEKLFARKFNSATDAEVLDALDHQLNN